jgi:hypothetical protein
MLWLVNPTMCLSLLCPCGHVVALDHLAALVMVMWLPTPIYCHDLRVALSAYNRALLHDAQQMLLHDALRTILSNHFEGHLRCIVWRSWLHSRNRVGWDMMVDSVPR